MASNIPTLKDALRVLNEAIVEMSLHYVNVDRSDIPLLCKSFKQAKEDVDELEKLLALANTIKLQYSYEAIPQAFENAQIDQIKLSGRTFFTTVRLSASIPADMRDAGHNWLQQAGYGSIIIPTANSRSLSSAIKGHIEETGKVPPKEAIKLHYQPTTNMRKT